MKPRFTLSNVSGLPALALVSTMLALPLVGCEQETKAEVPAEQPSDLGGLSLGLIEGRSVEIERWTNGNATTIREHLDVLDSLFIEGLVQGCMATEMSFLGKQVEGSANQAAYAACPPGVLTASTSDWIGGNWSTPFAAQVTLLCTAHWAEHFATSTTPTYVMWDDADFLPNEIIITTSREKFPAPWDTVIARGLAKESYPEGWLADDTNVRFVVQPPNASDRASWSLLAADLYRASALIGTRALNDANCRTGYSSVLYETLVDGSNVVLLDYMAANLSDALTSMMNAATTAQKHVNAAAAAAGSSGDVENALVSAWRGRHDSRLEATSIFTRISEQKFEQVQLLPLFQTGPETASYYTTTTPVTGHSRTKFMGWVYPPGVPQPPNTVPLNTYRASATSNTYFTTDESATWRNTHSGPGSVLVRHEGYVYAGDDGLTPRYEQLKSTATPRRFKWVKESEVPPASSAMPSGWESASDLERPFSHPVGPIEVYPEHLHFPVQRHVSASQGVQRAEALLRSTRVNPCLRSSGQAIPVTSWCAEALVGVSARDRLAIADDVLRVLEAEKAALFDSEDAPTLMSKMGIEMDELESAALRIVAQTQVLGRAIVPDPEWPAAVDDPATQEDERTRPRRVFGTAESEIAVHPAYLYAQTAGHFDFLQGVLPEYVWTGTAAPPVRGREYAESSVIAMLDVARLQLEPMIAALPTTESDKAWARMVKEGLSFVKQHLDEPLLLQIRRAAGNVTALNPHRRALPFANVTDLRASCDAWLGEAGLECAMYDSVGGLPCQRSRYQFSEAADGSSANPWAVMTTGTHAGWARFGLDASEAPNRGTPVALLDGERVYVTCNIGGAPQVVAALTVTKPPTDDTWNAYLPPYSEAMRTALTDALSADPTRPEYASLSCAGVPYNVKVKLEDELTEASEGKDDIESSFAHYLGRAREAATRADELGEELIEQGLQMDMRAEAARDSLEDLCGGVINVSALESLACSTQSCDIVRLLENAGSIADPGLRSDAEGLKRCLGIGDPAVNAVLGDQTVCVWNVREATGNRVHPACVCPNDNALCTRQDVPGETPGLKRPLECIYVPDDGKTCPAAKTLGGFTLQWSLATNLNFSVSNATLPSDTSEASGAGNRFSCGNLLSLRKHLTSGARPGWRQSSKWPDLSWITHDQLQVLADAMAFEVDEYLFPRVTVGGRVLVSVGDATTGPASPDPADTFSHDDWMKWPCAPHPMLNTMLGGSDADAAALCSEVDSLLCGGQCGNSSVSADLEQSRAHRQAGRLRRRLRDAVNALKGVSGATFRNSIWIDESVHPSLPFVGDGGVLVGALPSYHPFAPGAYANRSRDGRTWCWETGEGSAICKERRQRGRTPGLRVLAADDWWGGYPENPWFTWYPQTCLATDPVDDVTTGSLPVDHCGDMLDFMKGKRDTVRLQFRSCTQIPDSLCAPGGTLCGESLRGSAFWTHMHQWAAQEINPEIAEFIECWDEHFDDDGDHVAEPHYGYTLDQRGQLTLALDWPSVETHCAKPLSASAAYLTWFARDLVGFDCDGQSAQAPMVGSDVPAGVMLDALDLACVARNQDSIGCETLLSENYVPSDVVDFPTMSRVAGCAADRIEGNLQQMLLAGVPKSVADDISGKAAISVFPENRGEYGKTVALLAGEIAALRRHGDSVVQAIRDLELGFARSQAELAAIDLERDIKDVETYIASLEAGKVDLDAEISAIRTREAITSNTMDCMISVARAAGNLLNWISGPGELTAGGLSCEQSFVHVSAEREIGVINESIHDIEGDIAKAAKKAVQLGKGITAEQKQILLLDAAAKVNETMDRINEALISLQSSHATIQSYLADLAKQRNQAGRLAANVLMLSNDSLGRQYAVNTAMRARMNTLRVRYERAHQHAISASYLARRAIEQKLGVDLSLMTEDLTGVPAPNTWVDKLCSMSGIDYDAIRSSTAGQSEANAEEGEKAPRGYDYADGFVGDFVTLLENFVEAYRIDRPFQDGDGLAVVSLRDEILNVRLNDDSCDPVPGPNLLYDTDGHAHAVAPENAWETPCATTNSFGREIVLAQPESAEDESPFTCADGHDCSLPDVKAFRLMRTLSSGCQLLPANDFGSRESAAQALAYRFEAAHCSATAPEPCEDVSGHGAVSSVPAGAGRPSLVPAISGLGRQTTLSAAAGQGLYIDANVPLANAYTVTLVAGMGDRAEESGGFKLWSADTSGPGTVGTMALTMRTTSGRTLLSAAQTVWPLDAQGNRLPPTTRSTEFTAPSQLGPWIVSMRADATRRRIELWVNGQIVGWAVGAVHASNLDAQAVVTPEGLAGQLRVSALEAQGRWLSDAEVILTHHMEAQRHGIAMAVPHRTSTSIPSYSQNVLLERGTYMISWYQYMGGEDYRTYRAGVTAADGDRPLAVTPPVDATGNVLAVLPSDDPRLKDGWVRNFGTFDVPEDGLITVSFHMPTARGQFAMAAPQLERVDAFSSVLPQPYFPTGATRDAARSFCEDTHGDKFRSPAYWRHGCEYFCPPGSGLDCAAGGSTENLSTACFYETTFSLALEEIEKGNLIAQAGFARGNFNYRFNDIAVNLVGTAVKNCERSETPSACYANNHILYSLRHDEPFRVRNYDGDVYRAELYPGNIQQAQALLAERYITNPISSADRNLMTDYWRGELKGRPMDGNFRLRVYEVDGLNWDALEDIQLVIDYRYWTRER
jgi:hypothetical protein